jgi:hypothetical protein
MSSSLSALPKSPPERSHVSRSLLPSRPTYEPRLARLLSFHIHQYYDNSKKSVPQRHVIATPFFRKPLLLRRYVAAPSSCSKNASVIFSRVSRLLSKNAIIYTMSPRLSAFPKHRHTSSCISSLLRLQLRYINPVAELLPVLYNTHRSCNALKLEDTTLHDAAPSFCPQKTATRRSRVLLPSLRRSRRRV